MSQKSASEIIKMIVDNTNNHLSEIDLNLRESNRRIDEIISSEKLSPNVLNLLFEIKRNNNKIIVDNTVFKAVEIMID
jgi:hypothetical protein